MDAIGTNADARVLPYLMPRALTALATVCILAFAVWSVAETTTTADSGAQLFPISSLPDTEGVYDPVRAGEPLPEGFRQLIRRDGIAPIYQPTYVAATEVTWRDDLLVVGVAIEGEARAYPVAALNSREMVIDRIAGIPVLVTW